MLGGRAVPVVVDCLWRVSTLHCEINLGSLIASSSQGICTWSLTLMKLVVSETLL